MLYRPPKQSDLTPLAMFILNELRRRDARKTFGLKPPRGHPKNFAPIWMGKTEDATHHKIVRRHGKPVRESYTVKVKVIEYVDKRRRQHGVSEIIGQ